jgi:hypothetical protein
MFSRTPDLAHTASLEPTVATAELYWGLMGYEENSKIIPVFNGGL